MKIMVAGMALLLAAPAQAQTRAPARSVTIMPIDGWFNLAPAGSGLIRKFDANPGAEDTENITVYGRRGRDLEAEWRAAARAGEPQYEARNSAAAQPLYGGQAEWTSPEQQHFMSDAKDAMGLCGALGGLLTCPNK